MCSVDQPLHSILWAPGGRTAFFTRVLVVLGQGASVTFVHEAASPTEPDGQAMHAGIVEIVVGDGAQLTFVELQNWGDTSGTSPTSRRASSATGAWIGSSAPSAAG